MQKHANKNQTTERDAVLYRIYCALVKIDVLVNDWYDHQRCSKVQISFTAGYGKPIELIYFTQRKTEGLELHLQIKGLFKPKSVPRIFHGQER